MKRKKRGRLKGTKDKKPRIRRNPREIALGLTKEQVKEERERVERVAKAKRFMDMEEARKNRIERLKMMAGNKTGSYQKAQIKLAIKSARIVKAAARKEFTRTIRQKLREFMWRQKRFADTGELVAKIRRDAAIEAAKDPLPDRGLYRKAKNIEAKKSETQPDSRLDPMLSI